jgi:hypothetical protein
MVRKAFWRRQDQKRERKQEVEGRKKKKEEEEEEEEKEKMVTSMKALEISSAVNKWMSIPKFPSPGFELL